MRQLLEVLMRRRKVFLIPFLVVFLVPAILTVAFMRAYDADSLIWLDSDVTAIPGVNDTPQAADAKPIQQASDTLQQLLQTRAFVTSLIAVTPLRKDMATAKQREKTIAYVQKNLEAQVVGGNSMRITFSGKSGDEAVKVVGATTDGFVSWLRSEVRKQNEKSVAFFQQRSDQYEQQLSKASAALEAFRQAHPEVRELEIKDKVLTPPTVTISAALQADFERLKSDEDFARSLYDKSLDDLAKDRLQASAREERYVNGLRIVDKPIPPTGFAKKRLLLTDFLALLAAIVVGSVAVALAEFSDRTFHERHDVEQTLSLPVLVEADRQQWDVKKA